MRRIAQQGAAAEGPAGDRVAVDHREEERLGSGADDGGDVEPAEVPIREGGQEVVERAGPVPVLLGGQVGSGPAQLGDEVEDLAPVGQVGDRVAHELLLGMARPDHGAAVEHRVHLGHAPPEERAVPLERALVGVAGRPRRAVDAVGRHHQVRLHPLTVLEDGDGSIGARSSTCIRRRPRWSASAPSRSRTAPSKTSWRAPRWIDSWGHGIAGVETPRLAPDLLAAARAVEEERRRHGPGRQLLEESEGVELAHGVWQEVDADPERPDLRHGVEELDRRPRPRAG